MQKSSPIVLRMLCAFAIVTSPVMTPLFADPCGMVPPILPGPTVPLVRIGDQHTYVFYQDGIETVVIRPGFSGKVEEFGMLIPFPTPPALRKVSDDIFPHIAAAIDPPEVVIDLLPRLRRLSASAAAPSSSRANDKLEFDAVRVLRQEAVGMYEVAVLEAGSPQALKRWMDDHKYTYPEGMDKACQDYVNDGWCFVAVKTKVGQKKGVDPRPGQRDVNPNLPEGANFDGHVQAMGFRFKVDEMVVPMRLSTFNEGDLHNIVYILTDKPCRIDDIPTEFVKRQVTGEQLFKNLTELLPVRVIGMKQVPQRTLKAYESLRDPESKNGAAKDLFASDLIAANNGKLALPHEEREKALLAISESLGLRGKEIDLEHAETLKLARKKTVEKALKKIKSMTLTVVDGDFPREILANQNLKFSDFVMAKAKNNAEHYDAKLKAPTPKRAGIRLSEANGSQRSESGGFYYLSALAGLGLLGLAFVKNRSTKLMIIIGCMLLTITSSSIAKDTIPINQLANERLIDLFEDPSQAASAAEILVNRQEDSLHLLQKAAISGSTLETRGWAISCLGKIGTADCETTLAKIQHNTKNKKLIRTWAAAARVEMTETFELLVEKASMVSEFPSLGRPITKKLMAQLKNDGAGSLEPLLTLAIKMPTLSQSLSKPILSFGPEELASVMASAKDQNVRRQAAAFLGSMTQSAGAEEIGAVIVDTYKFDASARDVAWANGPLFVPGIVWPQTEARELVGNLIRWHVWADQHGRTQEKKQIHNNLRSLALAGAAGYRSPGFREIGTLEWLKVWQAVVGKQGIEEILKEQNVESKYRI